MITNLVALYITTRRSTNTRNVVAVTRLSAPVRTNVVPALTRNAFAVMSRRRRNGKAKLAVLLLIVPKALIVARSVIPKSIPNITNAIATIPILAMIVVILTIIANANLRIITVNTLMEVTMDITVIIDENSLP